jgi:hypothetical protein
MYVCMCIHVHIYRKFLARIHVSIKTTHVNVTTTPRRSAELSLSQKHAQRASILDAAAAADIASETLSPGSNQLLQSNHRVNETKADLRTYSARPGHEAEPGSHSARPGQEVEPGSHSARSGHEAEPGSHSARPGHDSLEFAGQMGRVRDTYALESRAAFFRRVKQVCLGEWEEQMERNVRVSGLLVESCSRIP